MNCLEYQTGAFLGGLSLLALSKRVQVCELSREFGKDGGVREKIVEASVQSFPRQRSQKETFDQISGIVEGNKDEGVYGS